MRATSAGNGAALPVELVTSLRWIADPVAARSITLPAQILPPRPDPAPGPPPAPASPAQMPMPVAEAASLPAAADAPPQVSGETELALDLAELGPVRLRIRDRRGRLALHVLADHPATLDLLRRHADELAGALSEVGLSPATLTWERGRQPGTPLADMAENRPAEPQALPAPRPRHDGDLDIVI